MPTITLLYAGILGLMSIGISAMAGSLRGKTGVSIGAAGTALVIVVASIWSIVAYF